MPRGIMLIQITFTAQNLVKTSYPLQDKSTRNLCIIWVIS